MILQKLLIQLCLLSLCFLSLLSYASFAFPNEITLKEKIGQMLMIGFTGKELHPDDFIVNLILEQKIGGVLLYQNDNISNPMQLKILTKELQGYTKKAAKNHKNNLYPLLIGVDYEGGKINPLNKKVGFPDMPQAAQIGKTSFKQALHYAEQMASILQKEGINLNFAPVLDVNVNPNNPIIQKLGRSFSPLPNQVIHYARIFAKAYQKKGIICTYKHFPGHGSSKEDTHQGQTDITDTWRPQELIPYAKLFKENLCPMVMTAHVVNKKLDPSGYPATLSSLITTDLLRKRLQFNGVIITDDMQMKAITYHYELADAITLAINAGANMIFISGPFNTKENDPAKLIDHIYHDVITGKIKTSKINDSYRRIMKLKHSLRTIDRS
jgi:beta-N-acetylhexosaminidase